MEKENKIFTNTLNFPKIKFAEHYLKKEIKLTIYVLLLFSVIAFCKMQLLAKVKAGKIMIKESY